MTFDFFLILLGLLWALMSIVSGIFRQRVPHKRPTTHLPSEKIEKKEWSDMPQHVPDVPNGATVVYEEVLPCFAEKAVVSHTKDVAHTEIGKEGEGETCAQARVRNKKWLKRSIVGFEVFSGPVALRRMR